MKVAASKGRCAWGGCRMATTAFILTAITAGTSIVALAAASWTTKAEARETRLWECGKDWLGRLRSGA
jgi:Ni/Fe-hydrogenase subunit HybB-like protein